MVKILYSYKLRSHPDKLLKDHLVNVHDIGLKKYKQSSLNIISEDVLKAILLFHDFGKSTIYFQDKIQGKSIHNEVLMRHSEVSALFCLYYLLQNGADEHDALLAYLAIKKHHGSFENLTEMLSVSEDIDDRLERIVSNINYDEIKEIYNPYFNNSIIDKKLFVEWNQEFRLSKLRRNLEKKLIGYNLVFYNKLNLYFSLLVYADKQDCIFNRELLGDNETYLNYLCVDEFKKRVFKDSSDIDKIRDDAYKEVENNLDVTTRIMSINLPTGIGKTLTAFNAALKLLKMDCSLKKIIYCLPFTSVIDQNSSVFEKVLQTDDPSIITTQHHLTEINTKKYEKSNSYEVTDNQAEFLIETWHSNIIITTFYQLLHTMLSGLNRQLKKYNNLANSIIILDEVQSIPRKYWDLVRRVFTETADLLNMKIILVTATMPLIFSEDNKEIKELAISKHRFFKSLNRIVLDVSSITEKIKIEDFCKEIISEIEHSDKSYLFILNTVNSSLVVYNFLKDFDLNPLYLSSNVIPDERLNRINQIRHNTKRQIVVSTQVVEAGVDIDFDVVYRDIAPLDSIFQACGRCNRNGKLEKGYVRIVELVSDTGNSYAKYVYDLVSLNKTKDILVNKKQIEEKDFFELSHEYYKEMKSIAETSTSLEIYNSMSLLKYTDAFCGKDGFELIKQEYKTVPVFIQVNSVSQELLTEYYLLLKCLSANNNSFENKVKIKNHFIKMQKYMLSIPLRYLPDYKDENFIIINSSQIPNQYNLETGFVRSPRMEDYFI
ncbi:MAG: CRISPR-associated helicase Cas3' [Candidatus Margulisbacteria bacterium]|nr:CRISPR-associated helicase Cas3' [Candidatus Margulisiibacteriota bacterium]